jgi:hypothetical protein
MNGIMYRTSAGALFIPLTLTVAGLLLVLRQGSARAQTVSELYQITDGVTRNRMYRWYVANPARYQRSKSARPTVSPVNNRP